MAASELHLPPGFRFHPTDDELVSHYLCRKCAGQSISVPIIAEIDLYKYNPWELPDMALYGEKEWYYFSPRDRKYPNGSRPNRAAGSGYWKATGADKPIGNPKPLAIKKALVFYAGKAPKGEKTNWIMHEYRLADVDRSAKKKGSGLRLDDYVLCRIYNKKGIIEKPTTTTTTNIMNLTDSSITTVEDMKPLIQHPPRNLTTASHTTTFNDYTHFDTSESMPRIHTDSSCGSDHVVSPEFTCEREVQSDLKWREFETSLEIPSLINNYNNDAAAAAVDMDTAAFVPFQGGGSQLSPLQDMFMFLQKPY